MKHYLITGGTGLVGTQLVNAIKQSDSHITILTRQSLSTSHPKITYVNWSEPNWEDKIPDIDIVINFTEKDISFASYYLFIFDRVFWIK